MCRECRLLGGGLTMAKADMLWVRCLKRLDKVGAQWGVGWMWVDVGVGVGSCPSTHPPYHTHPHSLQGTRKLNYRQFREQLLPGMAEARGCPVDDVSGLPACCCRCLAPRPPPARPLLVSGTPTAPWARSCTCSPPHTPTPGPAHPLLLQLHALLAGNRGPVRKGTVPEEYIRFYDDYVGAIIGIRAQAPLRHSQ